MRQVGEDRRRPDIYQGLTRVVAMLENPDQLRQTLARFQAPDGTVSFTFAPDAADFLRQMMGGVKSRK
jgi:hypothetical protein